MLSRVVALVDYGSTRGLRSDFPKEMEAIPPIITASCIHHGEFEKNAETDSKITMDPTIPVISRNRWRLTHGSLVCLASRK